MEMKEAIRLLNRAKSLLRHAHYNSREFDEHRKYLISSIEDLEERHDNDHIADAGEMVSLRDQFAMQAMQGIASNSSAMANLGKAGERELVDPDLLLSAAAYAIADAMLKERTHY